MSISSALNSAMSGLAAASRASEIVSGNIANAMTEGYARRSLELTSQTWAGSGVRVAGVIRHSDPVLVSDRRSADAAAEQSGTLVAFHNRLQGLFGIPGQGDSLTARLTSLETSLIEAAARPESAQRLDTAVHDAADLVAKINDISDGIQQLRRAADAEIATEVGKLNRNLSQLRELNVQIASRSGSGRDTAALLDLRQTTIDAISDVIPVREISRDRGQVALMTQTGVMLLDGVETTVEFRKTNTITAYQSLDAGHLSELGIGNRTVSADRVAGGRLQALFEIRDDLAVDAQTRLDAAAADLVQRFEGPGIDPTRAAGAPGLFTDAGAAFDPASQLGLASRLSLNTAVDSASGGASWRLRDGLGATTPGPEGDAKILSSLEAALRTPRPFSEPGFATGDLTAAQIGVDLMSRAGLDLAASEERMAFTSARRGELKSAELAMGVDTDAEMRTLMTVEQAYAANARVIQTVDEMMDILMGL